jgi:hypothetical protein
MGVIVNDFGGRMNIGTINLMTNIPDVNL